MLRNRKQVRRRRRRISFAQIAREIGPRAHTALRRARVALWRFKRSPVQQDRAAMYATFAFIGLFAVASVDAIIMGRADFGPGSAYAAEYQSPQTRAPAPLVLAAAEDVELPAAVKAATGAEVDYSFTTESLLGGPDLEIVGAPLFQDAVVDGVKVGQPAPVAAVELEPTLF